MLGFVKTKRILAGALCCAALCGLVGCGRNADPAPSESPTTNKLIYASEGVTEVKDENALQEAVDKMVEKANDPGISLDYRELASSTDGTNFSCYLANSPNNAYDMFFNIYADAELTDQLFLSDLLRPGTAFENIKLEHPLEPGTHTVYVAQTLVEPDLETIHSQIIVTMIFEVSE